MGQSEAQFLLLLGASYLWLTPDTQPLGNPSKRQPSLSQATGR